MNQHISDNDSKSTSLIAESSSYREKLLVQYRGQVPSSRAIEKRVISFFNIAGSWASIAGIYFLMWPNSLSVVQALLGFPVSEPFSDNGPKDYFLIAVTFSAMIWAIYRTLSTPTRASEEVYFSHEAIHIVRDHISYGNNTVQEERKSIIAILNAAEKAFTLVTKRKCSATIKIVSKGKSVCVSYTSESIGNTIRPDENDEISSYTSIASITRDDARFYICNDIWMAFRNGNYEHPNLKNHHVRGIWRQLTRLILEYFVPPKAPIGFRSTLVVPIRYIDKNFSGNITERSPYVYLGFLCIDSKSRRAFKSRVITEIAALYADAACSVFLTSAVNGSNDDANTLVG